MSNETQTTTKAKGPRILKHGILAAPCAVPITGPCRIGNYGKMDLPFDLDGQHFILPISLENPQYAALVAAFGEPATWTGATVQVSDGKMLKNVSVVPIANQKGKAVARPA